MPTYEYHCKKCGDYDVNQRITEPKLTKCPHCGGLDIYRKISGGGGILYNCQGFYHTDYKLKGELKNNLEKRTGSRVK